METIKVSSSEAINALFEGATELASATPYKIDCGIARRIRVFVTQVVQDRLAYWSEGYRAGNDELCDTIMTMTENDVFKLMEKSFDLTEMASLRHALKTFREGCNAVKGYNTY